MRKFFILFYFTIIFFSCSNSTHDGGESQTVSINPNSASENKYSDSSTVNSIATLESNNEKNIKPLNKITALINGEKFTSVSYTVNRFEIKKDTVYAIYSTSGIDRIIINYRGPAAIGTYNLMENAEAVYMDSVNTLYNAVDGFIAFENFDLRKKNIRGWFYFTAKSQDKNKMPVAITEGKLQDVEFFISGQPVNNSIQ